MTGSQGVFGFVDAVNSGLVVIAAGRMHTILIVMNGTVRSIPFVYQCNLVIFSLGMVVRTSVLIT